MAKVGLLELLILSVMGFAGYILYERATRTTEPPAAPHAIEHVAPSMPAPRPPEVVAAPAPSPEIPPDVEPAAAPPPPPRVDPLALPDALDATRVKQGIARVQRDLEACGPRYPDACGVVRLRVKVNPGGDVDTVQIVSTASQRLAKCASQAIKRATFGATDNGGTFDYPFNYGCP